MTTPRNIDASLFDKHPELLEALNPRTTKYIPAEFLKKVTPKQRAFLLLDMFEAFYGGAAGGGKLQPLDARVLTPKGWTTMGDVHVGDRVTDPVTGGNCTVLKEFPHDEMDIYEIECDDGAVTRAGAEHLWNWRAAASKKHRPRQKKSSQREYCKTALGIVYPENRWNAWKVGTTLDMIKALKNGDGVRIPLCEPVLFDVNGRTGTGILEPYLLGLMMGDGSYRHKTLYTADEEIREYARSQGFKPGAGGTAPDGGEINWIMTNPKRAAFAQWLSNNDLRGKRSWEKFIPDYVFTASVQYRLAFLQGLMDTDGTVDDRGRCSFCSTSRRLAEGVQALVRSLGGKARLRDRQTQYTYDGVLEDGRPSYQVRCWLPRTSALFRLSRKKNRCTDSWNGGHELTREVVRIEKVGRAPAKCIRVSSPYGLYITDDYIVTHNTIALLMGALQYVDVPHYNALLVRRTFADLFQPDAIGDMARQWLSDTDARWNERRNEWAFPSGAKLKFGYLDGPNDHYQYRSSQFQYIGFDEATELRSNQMVYLYMTRMRKGKSTALKNVPLRARFASNPGGVSHEWLYDHFISEDSKKEGAVFIPANLSDNPNLDEEYGDVLERLKTEDITEYQRLRHGSWEAADAGTFFKQEWFMGQNVVRDVPVHAERVRYWDLASIDPSLAKRSKKDPDWTVGALLALDKKGLCYIEDIIRVQKTPGAVEDIIISTAEEDGTAVRVYIEQEPGQSGVAQIDRYRMLLAGFRFEGDKATGSKESYAAPFAAYAEAGNVRVLFAPWNKAFRTEAEGFPASGGMHDDQVDAVSKAFAKLTRQRRRARAWGRR